MSCVHPLLAVYKGKESDGKKKVQILTRIDDINSVEEAISKYEHFGHRLLLLPCGKCPACLKARRKEWAVRCAAEAKYYADNCFVTLTYDDEFLPKTPQKKHYQDFIRALRRTGVKCRYFGCSERGSKTGRLHFHIIFFGYMPADLKASHKSDSGFWCYTSKTLSDLWKKGLVVVSEFTPETAAYVAGYVDKKFSCMSDDSFIFMSTKPGIGRVYVEENLGKLYEYDQIIVSYGSHKLGLPRYFDKVAEEHGIFLDHLKEKRAALSEVDRAVKMRDLGITDFSDLFAYQLQEEVSALNRRKRGL